MEIDWKEHPQDWSRRSCTLSAQLESVKLPNGLIGPLNLGTEIEIEREREREPSSILTISGTVVA